MERTNIVVLGAGVSGLTVALLLSQNPKYSITIVAKHMPGDYDIEYASPWAGANYMPFSKEGTREETLERNTWPEFNRLAKYVPEAGIHYQDCVLYGRKKDVGTPTGDFTAELLKEDPWYMNTVPNFRVLKQDELPAGIDHGLFFTSVCINTALYLPWLVSQCLKNGVIVRRGTANHIKDAASMHATAKRADLIVNCTALSSLKLGGVNDPLLFPLRGQTVLVRNEAGPMVSTSGCDDAPDEFTYTMTRAAGGGCILGGCAQENNWNSQPDLELAKRIMERAVFYNPALTNGKGIEALSVVRHGVGLRPYRKGGPRIEKERIDGQLVVHNYGHGGYGYQMSYGAGQVTVALIEDALKERAHL